MTHKQCWIKIAEAYDTPPEHRTRQQEVLASLGLCYARRICSRSRWLYDHWPSDWTENGYYMAPIGTPEGNTLRAIFAGLFAAMSEREWRALFKDWVGR